MDGGRGGRGGGGGGGGTGYKGCGIPGIVSTQRIYDFFLLYSGSFFFSSRSLFDFVVVFLVACWFLFLRTEIDLLLLLPGLFSILIRVGWLGDCRREGRGRAGGWVVDSWLISLVLGRKIVVGLDTPTSSLCGRLELSRRLRFSSPGSAPSRPPARVSLRVCLMFPPPPS